MRPSVYDFDDYRAFLADYLAFHREQHDVSFRQLNKDLGFKSPNYVQKIIAGERELTPKAAGVLAATLGLSEEEGAFFELLVARAASAEGLDAEIEQLRRRATLGVSHDQSIFSSWLHGVVWELASARKADTSFAGMCAALRGVASEEDVRASLTFLLAKGYLVETAPNVYDQKSVVFKYPDDRRRNVDIQRAHAAYLKMALHRLNDELEHREFQGLTIAVSPSRMPQVKERLRAFVKSLAEELAGDDEADRVLRVQCAAFRITK